VTVNSVLPGPTRCNRVEAFLTRMVERSGKPVDEMAADFVKEYLLQRFARVEEVANVVGYAASKEASATNGAALRVEGGIVSDDRLMQGADSSKLNPKAAIAARHGDQFRASLPVMSEWFGKLRSPRRSRGPSFPFLGGAVGTPFSSGASKVKRGVWADGVSHRPSFLPVVWPLPAACARISNPVPGSPVAERSSSPARLV
jgi:Enoyl-(Acyl carrier protein) reductase